MDKSEAVDWLQRCPGLTIHVTDHKITLIFESEKKAFGGKSLVEAVEKAIEAGF